MSAQRRAAYNGNRRTIGPSNVLRFILKQKIKMKLENLKEKVRERKKMRKYYFPKSTRYAIKQIAELYDNECLNDGIAHQRNQGKGYFSQAHIKTLGVVLVYFALADCERMISVD